LSRLKFGIKRTPTQLNFVRRPKKVLRIKRRKSVLRSLVVSLPVSCMAGPGFIPASRYPIRSERRNITATFRLFPILADFQLNDKSEKIFKESIEKATLYILQ
jgi:hypothetical protein